MEKKSFRGVGFKPHMPQSNRKYHREEGAVLGSRVVSQGLMETGERIRKRRQELHWSQEYFAEKAGISVNTVIRIEGGQSATSIEVLLKIEKTAQERMEILMERLLQKYPAPDKEAALLAWTSHMNMLTAMAEECVMNDLVYR